MFFALYTFRTDDNKSVSSSGHLPWGSWNSPWAIWLGWNCGALFSYSTRRCRITNGSSTRQNKKEVWILKEAKFAFFTRVSITLCIGSGLSSRSSSKFPEIALFSSGPASCKVLRPALNEVSNFFSSHVSVRYKLYLYKLYSCLYKLIIRSIHK